MALKTSAVQVPACSIRVVQSNLEEAIAQEKGWIKNAMQLLDKDNLCSEDAIAWSAYHASLQPPVHAPTALYALLPLFYEKAATPAMIKHGVLFSRLEYGAQVTKPSRSCPLHRVLDGLRRVNGCLYGPHSQKCQQLVANY